MNSTSSYYQPFGHNPIADALQLCLPFIMKKEEKLKGREERIQALIKRPMLAMEKENQSVHNKPIVQQTTILPRSSTFEQIPQELLSFVPKLSTRKTDLPDEILWGMRSIALRVNQTGNYLQAALISKQICEYTLNEPEDWNRLIQIATKVNFQLGQYLCMVLLNTFSDAGLKQLAMQLLAHNQVHHARTNLLHLT